MENNTNYEELMEAVFDDEYDVNMEMDEVNPWMMIASESGSDAAAHIN